MKPTALKPSYATVCEVGLLERCYVRCLGTYLALSRSHAGLHIEQRSSNRLCPLPIFQPRPTTSPNTSSRPLWSPLVFCCQKFYTLVVVCKPIAELFSIFLAWDDLRLPPGGNLGCRWYILTCRRLRPGHSTAGQSDSSKILRLEPSATLPFYFRSKIALPYCIVPKLSCSV